MNHNASLYRGPLACRCDACTEDHRLRYRKERAARFARCVIVNGRRIATNPHLRHGTVSTYANHGCQCPQCTAANTAQSSNRRQRRKETRRA